jgi:hypothetical protein
MRQLKGLAFVTVAITALICSVGFGVASATILTAPAGTPVPVKTIIKGELEKGVAKIETVGLDVECAPSTFEGEVTSAGGVGIPVGIALKTLTFTGCKNCPAPVVIKTGTLEVQSTGMPNGKVIGTGQEITTTCGFLDCTWTTNKTELGPLAGGAVATFAVNAVIPFSKGLMECGANVVWKGSYKITAPAKLSVD